MLYIGERKIPKRDILAVLPAMEKKDAENGAKSILLLASGETIQTRLSSSTLKNRLNGTPLPPLAGPTPEKR